MNELQKLKHVGGGKAWGDVKKTVVLIYIDKMFFLLHLNANKDKW